VNIKKIRKYAEKHTQTNPQDALRHVNNLSDYLRDVQEGIFRGPRVDQLSDMDSLISLVSDLMGFERESFYKDYSIKED
tara:strand:- start:582 stop:818 length:237 start_codon:yes stop_codon:yes gene_type:complete